MSWLARLINVFRAGKVSDDIDRELAFHLAERADELTAAGASPEAARLEARRRLGNYTMQHENIRERDLLVWLESFFADVRYGLRALVKQPIFAITTILTLAIGIGANTTVFTLLHGLLLRSLPVTAPQELVRINLNRDTGPVGGWLDYGMLKRIDELDRTFVDMSAWRNQQVAVEDADGTLRHIEVAFVTGNAFDLLGLRPRLGRLITASDDVAGGPPDAWPVVLSDRYWRERFDADASALGKTIRISGQPVTVIGITPGAFHGVWPGVEPAMYLPLHYMSVISKKDIISPPDSRVGVSGLGRLKPGLSVADARADLTVHERRLIDEFEATLPPELRRRLRLQVESGQTGLPTMFRDEYSGPLFLMQGLVGVVLLLCCVNVSGLMLSKLHERQHEFAVRTAIGAGSLRLVRQYLTESFLIAFAGAALGAAAAWYGTPFMLPFFRTPMQGEGMRIEPDQTVFLVTALSAIVTTLFFGALPAWRAARGNPAGVMKSRSAVQRPTSGRGFVAAQVALSLVLVVIAALLSQSLLRLQNEHTGFALDQVTIQTAPFHLLGRQGDERLDSLQPHGGAHRALVQHPVRRRHLVHADDGLPVERPLRGIRRRRDAADVDAGLQPRRPRLLPDDDDEDSGWTGVRAARAAARRVRAERRRGTGALPRTISTRPVRALRGQCRPRHRARRKRRPSPLLARRLPRRRHRRGREVRQPARRAAEDDLFPADARSPRRQPRVPAECADEGGRHLGVSRRAARDRADGAARQVRYAA